MPASGFDQELATMCRTLLGRRMLCRSFLGWRCRLGRIRGSVAQSELERGLCVESVGDADDRIILGSDCRRSGERLCELDGDVGAVVRDSGGTDRGLDLAVAGVPAD